MKEERINLWQQEEYDYPMAYGFQPNIHTYFHEDDACRPCILIVPGGGYTHCAEGEGEIVAKTFYEFGYHTAVVTYTCNLLYMAPLHRQPLQDLSRAVRIVRSLAEEHHIDAQKIAVMGFSAGAHLSGSLAEYHAQIADSRYPEIDNSVNRLILCYPVVTGGEYAHRNSLRALYGDTVTQAEKGEFSLENHISEDLCPVFLWQTMEDASVPVENSYLMALALRRKGIPFEHHVFTHGRHGLSVSTPQWEACDYGDPYTLEQCYSVLEQVKNGNLIPADPQYAKEQIFKFDNRSNPESRDSLRVADREVSVWPNLCNAWLKRSWSD